MGKNGLKIYYGEKLIRINHRCPTGNSQEILIWHYKDGHDLAKVFIKFAENESYGTLFLWSGSAYKELKTDFLSLFRISEAAGGVVKNEKGEILVIFRGGKWDLPKGKIEGKKETHRQAALREVQEETGLKNVKIVAPLITTYHIYIRKERLILKPTYWFEMFADSSNKLTPQSKEDISIVTWVEEEELKEIQKNTYSSLKDVFTLPQLYQH
jgi:8-oxo-dGTP pyrophosphatase MutT (NUDIX family)